MTNPILSDRRRTVVWFIDRQGTKSYHLYPDCGHLRQKTKRELSQTNVMSWNSGDFESFDDWGAQRAQEKTMCDRCLRQARSEYFEYSLNGQSS